MEEEPCFANAEILKILSEKNSKMEHKWVVLVISRCFEEEKWNHGLGMLKNRGVESCLMMSASEY